MVGRSVTLLALLLLAGAVGTACGDLKAADPPNGTAPPGGEAGEAGEAARSPDAPADGGPPMSPIDAAPLVDAATSARTGPGPHGSLPSGYCCTSDSECRYRHCVDVTAFGAGAGPKMCLDECYDPRLCTRPDLAFTCQRPGSGAGLCIPPAGGFTCLDPTTFTRGPKDVGACCNGGIGVVNDGTAGSICEGNTCMASGANPLICTHRCVVQSDCPGGYVCDLLGTSKACLRVGSPYTCTP